MQFRRAFGALAALTAALVCSVACKHNEAELSASTKSWQDEVRTRRAQIEKVKAENSAGFEAMDAGSLGHATLEMIPYVVFRVLQETEPATFGDDALNASGFFPRKDLPSRHNGIIWTDQTQAGGAFQLHYVTRTCSSCPAAAKLPWSCIVNRCSLHGRRAWHWPRPRSPSGSADIASGYC